LGRTQLSDDFTAWVYGTKQLSDVAQKYRCNFDSMNHTPKGVLGLRIDGVNNVVINNLKIENLMEASEVGTTLCGEYNVQTPSVQRLPFQIGYSGNMMQGVSIDYSTVTMQDVSIKNLESKTGMSVGISLWYGTEITMKNKIEIQSLIAGSDVEKNTFARKDRPNHAPEVCGIRVIDLLNDDETEQIIHLEESCEINIECVEGHVDCDGSDENYATLNKKMSFMQCQKNDNKKKCQQCTQYSKIQMHSLLKY